MTMTQRIVRDFIYLDADRLYSLYSQLFDGVTEAIVHSSESSRAANEVQKGGILSGSEIDTSVFELLRKSENRILHDELYNRLELKIGAEKIDVASIKAEDLTQWYNKSSYIKATGVAEIEDYERMKSFIDNFNRIGEAIAYSSMQSDNETNLQNEQLGNSLEGINERNTKAKLKNRSRSPSTPRNLAREMAKALGLVQDEQMLANLKFFCEFFAPSGFDITVAPRVDRPDFTVRARTDRRWLRLSPEMIRSLYGAYSAHPWSVVGQVTWVPNAGGPPPARNQVKTEGQEPSMREPMRNMFLSTHAFENMFMASDQCFEVIVHPLAIYREYTIPVHDGSGSATV